MMYFNPTKSANQHIDSLQAIFEDSMSTIEWLVIAHNNSRMVRSLSSALSGESAAVLEVSQDAWEFDESELPETIEWALQQGEIKNLVLVGHSQTSGSTSRASLVSPTALNGLQNGCDRLIASVQQANAEVLNAQTRFATQVNQMSQIPVVHKRWSNGDLTLNGLFYRAECGVFLAYESEQKTFRPLLSY